MSAQVELDDIQALLRYGFKHLTRACFVLLRVKNSVAARAWLATVPVNNAAPARPLPMTALQVALSAPGLRALGVPEDLVAGFSAEFLDGLADPNRARRLGDIDVNQPARWRWGAGGKEVHALVMLYAAPEGIDALRASVLDQVAAGFETIETLMTADLDGKEPFGFVDGISQPELDWQRTRPAQDKDQLAYTNLACLGEFLLGYPNEYGRYTDRPVLDPARDPSGVLLRAEDDPARVDVGRNGSYLVLRELRQDVRGFWRFASAQTGGDPSTRQQLAEAMVGRRMGGEPMVVRSSQPIPGVGPDAEGLRLNGFTFDDDIDGTRCPFGAHVRRSNPRNADLPAGTDGLVSRLLRVLGFDTAAVRHDLMASTRFHRLLRRGRKFGVVVSSASPNDESAAHADSGLYFICLGANVARQFEFVQGAWAMSRKFNGLKNEGDPLLGNRSGGADGAPADRFTMPQPNGPDRCVAGLPQFVTVSGGGYFFLPGIRALRYLANAQG